MTLIAALVLTAAVAVKPPDPVKDCPIGLVCFTVAEVGEIDRKVITLERDIAIAKARVKRFGFVAGCGPGVAVELIEGKVNVTPNINCSLAYGIRW